MAKVTAGASNVGSAQITDDSIVNADINSAAAIALSKLATDPLARANHTGTQAAATISDLATAILARAQHTGTQLASTISDLATAILARSQHTGTQLASTISDFNAAAIAAVGAPTVLTLIPRPQVPSPAAGISTALATNTTLLLYQFVLQHKIVVNKITIRSGSSHTTNGTADITIYAEDGQSQLIAVTTPSITAADQLVTATVSAVTLNPGVYWFAINSNDTLNTTVGMWSTPAHAAFALTAGIPSDVTSEPVLAGTVTITASTPPATITPTSITEDTIGNVGTIFRLDT